MSDAAFRIIRCEVGDLQHIIRLLDDVFHLKNPYKEDFVRWKYFAPCHKNQTVMYAALNEANDFVSLYTNSPIMLRCGLDLLPGMVCTDMVTLRRYRGRGLISTLARHVYRDVVREGAVMSIGFSNEEGVKVDQNASGYGYQIVGKFRRYAMMNWPFSHTAYRLQPVSKFEETPYRAESCHFRIEKSCAYLNWRYRDKPANNYLAYQLVQEGRCAGYVVIRETPTHAYVYDIVTDENELPRIIPAIRTMLWQRGKRIAVWYVLDNSFWRQTLRGAAIIPAAWRQTHYYLTIKPHSPMLGSLSTLCSPENWWMMAGDIF